jgi:hypothetical protein
MGVWLCLNYVFVYLSIVIFLYVYVKHLFPIETIIRNASKGGKPYRNQHLWFSESIQKINQ